MIGLDAADLIDSLSTGAYTVTRRAAATYANGIAQPGSTSTLQITAAMVPTSGRDLQRLPEGRRTQETRTVYTTTLLLAGAQGGANEADLVLLDTQQWEVQTVWAWPGNPGFYAALCQRPNLP